MSEKIRLYSTFEPPFGFGWASDWTVIDNAIAEMTGSDTKELLLDNIDWFITDGATDFVAIANALQDGESAIYRLNGEIVTGIKKENGQIYEWVTHMSGNNIYSDWNDEPSILLPMLKHSYELAFKQENRLYEATIMGIADEVAQDIGTNFVIALADITETEVADYYTTTPPTPSSNPSNTEEEEPNDPVNDDYFFEPIEDVADLRDTFWQDGHHKDLIITDGVVTVVNGALSVGTHEIYITNSELHSESFQLDEAICQDEDLNFGEASASCIHFKFSGDIIALKGKQLRVYMYLDNNPNTLFQLGIYKVESDIPTADRLSRGVTAYDALYDVVSADVASWYKGISFPVTLRAFFTSFMSKFGITIDNNADLINANMVVRRTVDPDTLSGKDVLTACLQAFGCFGRIGRNGHFQFVYLRRGIRGLYPRVDLYPKDTLYPREALGVAIGKSYYIPPCQYEDYLVSEIDKLEIRDDDNSIGTTVGSGNNAFVVSGNFLFYGMNESDRLTYATAIYNRITGIVYRPYSTDMLGNPSIQCGDVIRLNTSYTTVEAYVLKRSLKGIQALRDTISADGQQTRSDNVNSLSTRLKNVETKTTTEIKTVSDQIELCVTKEGIVSDLNNKMSSSITITPDNINIGSDGAFTVNTSNFKLLANGNATFSGSVSGATISGSSLSSTGINNGLVTETKIAAGNIEINYGTTYIKFEAGYISLYQQETDRTSRVEKARISKSGISFFNENGSSALGISTNSIGGCSSLNGGTPITSANISSYSVGSANYATSAGSASTANTAGTALTLGGNSDYVSINTYGNLVPNSDSTMRCGGSTAKWSEVWAENGTIKTSDRNRKNSIEDLSDKYVEFMRKLMPKRFKMNSGTSNRYHMGFIAQDVEALMAECGIENAEFAGLIIDHYQDENGNDAEYYALRYDEFIAPLVMAWQETEDRLNNLINTLTEKGVI